jgi:hypothetical protein
VWFIELHSSPCNLSGTKPKVMRVFRSEGLTSLMPHPLLLTPIASFGKTLDTCTERLVIN